MSQKNAKLIKTMRDKKEEINMNGMIKIANEIRGKAIWSKFNYTSASISDLIDNRYILIKSYNTIVAMVDTYQNKLFEFGKYSRTTSKQITQINNQMFSECERIFINETNW